MRPLSENQFNSSVPPVPYGYCHCGCGRKTTIATHTNPARGSRKGQPTKYLRGHGRRIVHPHNFERYCSIEDRGHDTPCWIWQGFKDSRAGYAVIGINGRPRKVHQISYKRFHGEVPAGKEIDHVCGNRACVNPDHLEAVSHTENCRRGRKAVLIMEQAEEIRRLKREHGLKHTEIAEMFDVSATCIWNIVHGNRWA